MEEFVVVAFPVLEYPELKRYTHPTAMSQRFVNLALAEEAAEEYNLLEGGINWTYAAMSVADFNEMEW